ncbi:MAG TPA: hypothetical protein VM240_13535 [Verrucomicrobiae bacterium]|nr:hypothetical protein [Verrucomicrobiae bacterium]
MPTIYLSGAFDVTAIANNATAIQSVKNAHTANALSVMLRWPNDLHFELNQGDLVEGTLLFDFPKSRTCRVRFEGVAKFVIRTPDIKSLRKNPAQLAITGVSGKGYFLHLEGGDMFPGLVVSASHARP